MEQHYTDLALHQMGLGNSQGAIENLKQALTINPENGLLHAYLAGCLLNSRRLYAAQYEIDVALDLSPNHPMVHYSAGLIGIASLAYERAEQHLQEALALDGSKPDVLKALAEVYGLTHRTDLVVPTLEEGLRLDPEHTGLLTALGEFYFDQGKDERAYHYAKEALGLAPEQKDAHVLMGHICLQHGLTDQAREHAITALNQAPGDASALVLLSSIKTKTNWLFGLWWRYNTWMSKNSDSKSILIIILAFLTYRLSSQLMIDFGYGQYTVPLMVVWIAFCAYTWTGQGLFEKAIKKELQSVQLKKTF